MLVDGPDFEEAGHPAPLAGPLPAMVGTSDPRQEVPMVAGGSDDLAFLSDAARSKVVELVRSISAQFAGGADGLRRELGQKAAGGRKDKDRLRAIWTESLANDISARSYNEASIRISRERREVWVCRPGPSNDPAPKTYRMPEQPKCFETHMKLWEASTRGFDLSIDYLRKSLAKLDEPAPETPPAPPPLPRKLFGRARA